MEKESFDRYVPEHPLPEEIRQMEKGATVCQFCGVSYLIHSEMKALEERVEEAERQMEFYKGSVEREKKLKVTVQILQEEKDKLSRALQASEDKSKTLTSDLMSKTELIQNIKTDNEHVKEKWMRSKEQNKQLEERFQELSALWFKVQANLSAQKVELNWIKGGVKDNEKHLSDIIETAVMRVTQVSGDFASRMKDKDTRLRKVEMERDLELDKCRKLVEEVEKQKEEIKALRSTSVHVQKLMVKCTELEGKTRDQQTEIKEQLKEKQLSAKEIAQLQEMIRATSKELDDCKLQSREQEEVLRDHTAKLQDAEKAKESEVYRLNEKCKLLEENLSEFAKDQHEDKRRVSSSQEELVVLRHCLAKAKGDVNELIAEREKMITAHHNRIEQLRENFKRKMEEADKWPVKLEQMRKVTEDAFAKEKQELWMELSDSFQKEIEEERKHHAEELLQWKSEAESAQGKFKQDISSLNRKRRDEVKRLERAVAEEKDRLTQNKQTNAAVIDDLQAKVFDLERRLQQPKTPSSEDAVYVKARLQECRDELHETEAHCKELEANIKQYKEEVFFLQETVHRECEERLELTESLSSARTQLLASQRNTGTSLSRNSLCPAKPSASALASTGAGAKKAASSGELVNSNGSQAATCAVGFDSGVGRRAPSTSRDSGRLSRAGSVDDSRQRIAVALGRPSSKSRLGGDQGS